MFRTRPKEVLPHVGPGYPVGYQVRGTKAWDDSCNLVYATDGSVVNWIANGDLAKIGTLIVDEAHERSENIDLILTLLAAKLPRYPHLRVIVASATIDVEYFHAFFGLSPSVQVATYSIEARKEVGYGIPLFSDINFTQEILESGYTLSDRPPPEGRPTKLNAFSYHAADGSGESVREFTKRVLLGIRVRATQWPRDVEAASVEQTIKILEATSNGDIIVFLPTRTMIENVRTRIEAEAAKVADAVGSIQVVWYMREAPESMKKAALAPPSKGTRKVIVSSNLAETSLTVEGIRYIVDSGLVLQPKWDPDLVIAHYPVIQHSKAGVRQRWGRVGRTTDGWVFPLYTLAQYEAMAADSPPGSVTQSLEGSVLKLLLAGESPADLMYPTNFDGPGVVRDKASSDSADLFTRERARALNALVMNGAVTNDGRSLTRLGQELAGSQLPPEQAIALKFADRLACVPEVATALVVLGGLVESSDDDRGVIAGPTQMLNTHSDWPLDRGVLARRCHEALAAGCLDELDLVIRVFSDWSAAANPSVWCAQWWVNQEYLLEVQKAAGRLMDDLSTGLAGQAQRPLDPRLAVRARAVFSRALASFRYQRGADGSYRSINSRQPAPLFPGAHKLVVPADDVVALVRHPAPDRKDRALDQLGEMSGLVAVYPWATKDEPSDFELLCRVRDSGVTQQEDSTKDRRNMFPIGSTVRIEWSAGGPNSVPQRVTLIDDLNHVRTSGKTRRVSQESRPGGALRQKQGGSSDELDPRSFAVAGSDAPDEEVELIPVAIEQLEQPLEIFSKHLTSDVSPMPAPNGPTRGAVPLIEVLYGLAGRFTPEPANWTVVGYGGTPQKPSLIVEPAADLSRVGPRTAGQRVQVQAVGLARTNSDTLNVFRECDSTGELLPGKPYYIKGVQFGKYVKSTLTDIATQSIWNGRLIPSGGADAADLILSLIEDACARLRTAGDKRSASGNRFPPVLADLTARRHIVNGQEYWIASVTAGIDYTPQFLVRVDLLEAIGMTPLPGARLKLSLDFDRHARKSGVWTPDEIERILKRHPGVFETNASRETLELAGRSPLSDAVADDVGSIVGDPQARFNTWNLWVLSRQVRVAHVEAVMNIVVDPVYVSLVSYGIQDRRIRQRFSVGINVGMTGLITITGKVPAIVGARQEIVSLIDTITKGRPAPVVAPPVPAIVRPADPPYSPQPGAAPVLVPHRVTVGVGSATVPPRGSPLPKPQPAGQQTPNARANGLRQGELVRGSYGRKLRIVLVIVILAGAFAIALNVLRTTQPESPSQVQSSSAVTQRQISSRQLSKPPTTPRPTNPADLVTKTKAQPIKCGAGYIVQVASNLRKVELAQNVKNQVASGHLPPNVHWAETKNSCAIFSVQSNAYVAYAGPFRTPYDACPARLKSPADAFIKQTMPGGFKAVISCICYPTQTALPKIEREGQKNLWIGDVQRILRNKMSYAIPDLDGPSTGLAQWGIYSPATREAVKQFQLDNGLSVDGILGPATWAALRSATC